MSRYSFNSADPMLASTAARSSTCVKLGAKVYSMTCVGLVFRLEIS